MNLIANPEKSRRADKAVAQRPLIIMRGWSYGPADESPNTVT